MGVGVFVGSKLAGYIYGHYGEKANLALRYLAEHTALGQAKGWNGSFELLEKSLGIPRADAMRVLCQNTGLSSSDATQLLWNTYHPHLHVWIPFACIGVAAAVALWIFGRMAKRWNDMNG